MQELGGAQVEADGSVLESAAGEQNRRPLCRSLLRAVENVLENHPLMFYAPRRQCRWFCFTGDERAIVL